MIPNELKGELADAEVAVVPAAVGVEIKIEEPLLLLLLLFLLRILLKTLLLLLELLLLF